MTEMLAYILAAIGVAAAALLSVSRSHRTLQILSISHAGGCLTFVLYGLAYYSLPVYYGGGYLFIDHLGLYEAMIASAVFLLAAVYAGGYVEGLIEAKELKRENLRIFYVSFNLLLTVTLMCFFCDNLALFWIFTELTTFFSAVLIAILSSRKNVEASLRYVFVTSISMLVTFIGLIFLFALTKHAFGEGTLTWTVLMAGAKALPPKLLAASFILVFVGFAAKAGISPLHTWLPHAHGKAPSAVSAILSGTLLNVGIYGILRMYAIVARTDAAETASRLMVGFGVLTVGIAAFTMLRQRNLKKLIAFSSIEHMGLMLVGIGVWTPAAVFWTLYHMLAHSLTKTLLFFSAGILHRQYHSNKAEDMKDVFRLQPVASLGLAVGACAIGGMPPFPMFASKLMLLLQAWGYSGGVAFALLGLLLVASASMAAYLVRLFSHVSEHEPGAHLREYRPNWTMEAPILLLVAALLAAGLFFPQWLGSVLEAVLGDLMLGGFSHGI